MDHPDLVWLCTGTPITSRLDELQGLLDFLAVQPFGEPAVFRALLKIPYEARSVAGLQRLRVLLKTIMIRRTKSGVRNSLGLIYTPLRMSVPKTWLSLLCKLNGVSLRWILGKLADRTVSQC